MYKNDQLDLLIEQATAIAGSQRKLAAMLDMEQANFAKIKKGERPANYRVRAKLRAIVGEAPDRAYITAVIEDLEQSENEDEKKAADGLKAILAAFPANAGWRKR